MNMIYRMQNRKRPALHPARSIPFILRGGGRGRGDWWAARLLKILPFFKGIWLRLPPRYENAPSNPPCPRPLLSAT